MTQFNTLNVNLSNSRFTNSLIKNQNGIEVHLRLSEFTDSACGLFVKNKEKIQKFKKVRESRYNLSKQTK